MQIKYLLHINLASIEFLQEKWIFRLLQIVFKLQYNPGKSDTV